MNPLKAISLAAWAILFLCQLGLFWSKPVIDVYWILLVSLPLLLPAKGLLYDHHYTYKCLGFMTLAYICIGISELATNPDLKIYAFVTTISSTLLFLSSIYYARYLAQRSQA